MNGRDRRALGLGTMAIVVAVSLRAAPALLQRYLNLRSRTSEQVTLASRAAITAEALPGLSDTLQNALHEFVGIAPKLFSSNATDATAELSALISAAADRPGLRVLRSEGVSADTLRFTSLRAVMVSAELEGDVTGVAELLLSLGRGNPVVAIDAIAIAGDTLSSPSSGQSETLRIRLRAIGWRLPEKAS